MSAGPVTPRALETPQGLATFSFPSFQSLYPWPSSLGITTVFCACVYAKQYRWGTAQQTVWWVEMEGEPSAVVTS